MLHNYLTIGLIIYLILSIILLITVIRGGVTLKEFLIEVGLAILASAVWPAFIVFTILLFIFA